MKKTLFIIAGITLLFACKKDPEPVALKAFTEITLADIKLKEANMTAENIVVISANNNLKPGAILLYKTAEGSYGKIKINSIVPSVDGLKLSINLAIYDKNGLEVFNKSFLDLDAAWQYDLDTFTEGAEESTVDFIWDVSKELALLIPHNGAVFYIYSN